MCPTALRRKLPNPNARGWPPVRAIPAIDVERHAITRRKRSQVINDLAAILLGSGGQRDHGSTCIDPYMHALKEPPIRAMRIDAAPSSPRPRCPGETAP